MRCFRAYVPVAVHDSHANARDAEPNQRRSSVKPHVHGVAVEALHQRQRVPSAVQNTHLRQEQGQEDQPPRSEGRKDLRYTRVIL